MPTQTVLVGVFAVHTQTVLVGVFAVHTQTIPSLLRTTEINITSSVNERMRFSAPFLLHSITIDYWTLKNSSSNAQS